MSAATIRTCKTWLAELSQEIRTVARRLFIHATPEEEVATRTLRLIKGTSATDAFQAVLTDDHNKLRARLGQSQRMETLGRLTCSVTHDFQNVLTVIMGYGDMLLEALGENDPMRTTLVREIQKVAEHGAGLTSQLLAYSRKQTYSARPIDLAPVATGMEQILRRLLGRRIEIVMMHGEPARVSADPAQMEQVLLNLALNARDAMPEGGRLTIQVGPAVVDDAMTPARGQAHPGRYVALTVTDTGTGIDAGARAHLFEPFFTTKEPGKGTGLGLSIVADIVSTAGGFIEVSSTPGHGTSFRVCLPQVEAAVADHRSTGSARAS
jgi:signal transduction histidine kinase